MSKRDYRVTWPSQVAALIHGMMQRLSIVRGPLITNAEFWHRYVNGHQLALLHYTHGPSPHAPGT